MLTLKDTNVLKGLALLFLLIHHNGLYDDICLVGEKYLVQSIGIWCKLCVAIFVFLSGYGLTVGVLKKGGSLDTKRFLWHRFSKLLMNYWFIWVLFVPIGIFVFDRIFEDAYNDYAILKFFLDFFGIINCFGWYGYNVTWWFYSCIIILYLLFPYLYRLMNYSVWLLLGVTLAIFFFTIPFLSGMLHIYIMFCSRHVIV